MKVLVFEYEGEEHTYVPRPLTIRMIRNLEATRSEDSPSLDMDLCTMFVDTIDGEDESEADIALRIIAGFDALNFLSSVLSGSTRSTKRKAKRGRS